MSGVWVFKNGIVRLVDNPAGDSLTGKKVLVHVPSNEWERYYDDPDLIQLHKRSTIHLISLPKDFNKFRSMHMYDIVVKNWNTFEVSNV
ncbi:hypothetical protein CDL12_21778 [Handroanthus impetiginosus]|uniref:Uncharacterized protein n=1 Tax=Handroanthus impetiginosus TaxID=429701 RepID=A0A2G9GKY6_9LAMI|nr:hypothetical protein CDL12_21778 [Handroanthus impetiginosus]